MAFIKLGRIIAVKNHGRRPPRWCQKLLAALLPQPPPSMQLRTNWLFRNAERKGKAGQIFQAEVVPIRGLEPVNEGCPTWRKESRKEMWLKLQGRLICSSREGQAPGARLHRKGFTRGGESRRLRRPALAALRGPGRPGLPPGWARAPPRSRSAPQPAAPPGARSPPAAPLPRGPGLQVCRGAGRGRGRTSGSQAAFEVRAGRLGGRWMSGDWGGGGGGGGQRRRGPARFPRSLARGANAARGLVPSAECRMSVHKC